MTQDEIEADAQWRARNSWWLWLPTLLLVCLYILALLCKNGPLYVTREVYSWITGKWHL